MLRFEGFFNGEGQRSFVNAASFLGPKKSCSTGHTSNENFEISLVSLSKFISLSLGSPDTDMC